MFKDTKLYSIFFNKCPKCHEGEFFINKNFYAKGFMKMHNNCKNCNESFNKEVGFYYGAMYVSYALNVTLGVGLFLLLVLLLKLSLITYLISFAVIILLLFPWIIRISRLLYINMFVSYDPTKKSK